MSKVATTFLLLLSSFSIAHAADAPTPPAVTIVHIVGGATVRRMPLHEGDTVKIDDDIVVSDAPGSQVDLKLSEGHQIRLKTDTTFRVGSVQNNKRIVTLIKGKAFVHYVKGAGTPTFEIRTKVAVAGVRGTKFVTQIDEKKGTYFCVCEGVVEVSKPEGGPSQLVHKDEDLWSHAGEALKPPVNSPKMTSTTQAEFDSMNF
jgi:ferric-dicitrate binding protein FerR (iron transport regulator)